MPAAAPAEAPPAEEPTTDVAAEPATAPAVAAVAVVEPEVLVPVTQEIVIEEEPAEPLEPASLGDRLKVALKVGAWTGAGLGFATFFIFSAYWAPNASIDPDTGPIVVVSRTSILVGSALVSVLFGAIVAGLARASATWTNPAMQLRNSKSSTAWIGAVLGLVLGLAAGAMLSSLGTVVEGDESTLIQLPVIASVLVLFIGGAVLGAVTAVVPQILGTPVAVAEGEQEEAEQVKERLGGAIGIPLAGLLILLVLVVPFGYILLESNHLASGGAAIIAIVISAGILGFAALAGSRPEMRITFGDLMVAVAGIGTVLVIILAVLIFSTYDPHESEEADHSEAVAIVQVL